MKYDKPEMEVVELNTTPITALSVGDENSDVTQLPGI